MLETTIAIDDGDLKKLMRQFQRLPDNVARKVGRRAVNAGANPIVKALREAAPVAMTGNLKRSIGKKTVYYRDGNISVAVIGARIGGSKRPKGSDDDKPANNLGYHENLVENGHITKGGTYVPGHPFMNVAIDSSSAAAINAMFSKLAQGIEKEAAAT